MKSEGVTDVTPSIESVARCDGASSLALAGYLSFGLSANLALSERYARAAAKGKQGAHGYPQAGYLRLISLRTSSSNPQGQAEPSDGFDRDAHSQCIPVFFGVRLSREIGAIAAVVKSAPTSSL